MNKDVRYYLIEKARKQMTVDYQKLCDDCNLGLDMRNIPEHRAKVGQVLGEISAFEYLNERPLLSAIVITISNEEGDGFFKLCESLGITSDWRRLKRDKDFPVLEIKKCFDFWRDENNYKKYFNL